MFSLHLQNQFSVSSFGSCGTEIRHFNAPRRDVVFVCILHTMLCKHFCSHQNSKSDCIESIDACMFDAGCRSRAIGHSACILCSVIRMKFQCDRALGMHVFHAFNLHDEYMFIQFLPIFLIFTLDCTTLHACLHHRLRVTLAVLM